MTAPERPGTPAAGPPKALESSLQRTWRLRRGIYRASLALPWSISAALSFLALYPILVAPGPRLVTTLAALVGGGLSFTSVSFSAANNRTAGEAFSVRLAIAGSTMLQFSLAMAVALALAVARERLAELPSGGLFDYPLRALIAVVIVVAICLELFGFRTLLSAFEPGPDAPVVRRLRRLRELEALEEADRR